MDVVLELSYEEAAVLYGMLGMTRRGVLSGAYDRIYSALADAGERYTDGADAAVEACNNDAAMEFLADMDLTEVLKAVQAVIL